MSTIKWAAGVSGDWATGANWSTVAAPTAADDVIIDAAGTYQTTISTSVAALSLTLSDATATLLDSGALTLGGPLSVNAGVFNLDKNGALSWASGSGVVNVAGAATFHATGVHTLDNVQFNLGTPGVSFAYLSFDTLTLGANAVVSYNGAPASASSAFQYITGTSLTNNGTIEALQNYGSGLIYATSTLINNGALTNASLSGYTVEANDITNTGTISASNGGGIGISGFNSFTNTGVIDDRGGVGLSSANFVNNGQINISGGYFAIGSGVSGVSPISGTGAFNLGAGGTLQFTDSESVGQATINLTGAGALISVVSPYTNAPGGPQVATLTLGAGVTINQTAGTATLSDNTPLATGNIVISSATINASASGGLLTISNSSFVDNGAIAVSNGDHVLIKSALSGAGTISDATGGLIEIAGSAAATNTIAFKDGAGDLLKLDAPTTFASTITGFAQGDTIDLAGVLASSASWASNVLTVTETGGATLKLALSGNYAGATFNVASDGAGGTDITLGASSALAGVLALAAAIEGAASSTALASFTDGNPADTAAAFTATINWGDGTTSAGVVTALATGGFAVAAASGHVYAAEGTYAAAVTVTRTSDNATLALTGNVTVGEGDAFTVTSGPALALKAGQAFSGAVATFSDIYTGNTASDLKATIAWGDGSTSAGTLTDVNGVITVSGAHSYSAAGTDAISVTLSDVDGTATATATGSATVAPASTGGSTYTLTTGADTVAGGAGDNTIIAATRTLSKGDNINGGVGGVNTIELVGGGTSDLRAPTTLANVQVLQAQEGAGSAAETVYLRNGLNLTVNVADGGAGAGIKITGANDSSTINLGSGADVVTLGSATETVNGGAGRDTYNVTAATIGATIHGGSGRNTLVVKGGGTEVMGANITNIQTVKLAAAGSSHHFTANSTAGLVVDDLSVGNNDWIYAGAAGQTLEGGSGDQTFVGFGSGKTTYADTAKNFNGANIQNFNAADVIEVLGLAYNAQTSLAFDPSGKGSGDLNLYEAGVLQGQIHLSGTFAANGFALSSDGHGGTLVSAHP